MELIVDYIPDPLEPPFPYRIWKYEQYYIGVFLMPYYVGGRLKPRVEIVIGRALGRSIGAYQIPVDQVARHSLDGDGQLHWDSLRDGFDPEPWLEG